MAVKEVRPGDIKDDNILAKKQVRDIGSVGIDELVSKVQAKIAERVEKVATEPGETKPKGPAVDAAPTPELKKAYFNKSGIEKNMNTSAAVAIRGGTPAGQVDAKNLKLVVLPKINVQAEPTQVMSFGEKANIQAPFQMNISDLLSRLMERVQKKPEAAQRRMDKLSEKQKEREKKFGKKVMAKDADPNEFAEEEYDRQKKKKAVVKMFQYMNKALGQKMDMAGAPEDEPQKNSAKADDDDF